MRISFEGQFLRIREHMRYDINASFWYFDKVESGAKWSCKGLSCQGKITHRNLPSHWSGLDTNRPNGSKQQTWVLSWNWVEGDRCISTQLRKIMVVSCKLNYAETEPQIFDSLFRFYAIDGLFAEQPFARKYIKLIYAIVHSLTREPWSVNLKLKFFILLDTSGSFISFIVLSISKSISRAKGFYPSQTSLSPAPPMFKTPRLFGIQVPGRERNHRCQILARKTLRVRQYPHPTVSFLY